MTDSTNPRVMADNIKELAASTGGIVSVEANPTGTATADLEKLDVDGTIYGISESVSVEANPEGEATVDLEKLGVDGTIYGIPEGGLPDLSTTEVLTGRNYNGVPTYTAIVYFSEVIQINSNLSWYTMPGTMPANINNLISATLKHYFGGIANCFDFQLSNGSLQLRNHSMQNETFSTSDCVIIEYTKSS